MTRTTNLKSQVRNKFYKLFQYLLIFMHKNIYCNHIVSIIAFLGSGWAIDSFYNCPFTINRLQGMSLDHAESIECPTGGEGVPPPAGLPPIVGGTRRAFLVVLPAYYRGFTCPFTFCGIGF